MSFHKYVFILVLAELLASFSGSSWFNSDNDEYARFPRLPKLPQLFPSIGQVVEIPDGSMERFRDELAPNGVNAVLFYAPWCGQSLSAAHAFNKAAKVLYQEVSFIAINCWVGTCQQQQNIDVFPKLVAIHSQFNGLEYKGPFKVAKLVAFLKSIVTPFMYLGTNSELTSLKKSNQELVISYFNQPLRTNKNFTTFVGVALHFRIKDSRPTFAVVTSGKVALKSGVKNETVLVYHRLNHDVLSYPSSSYFTIEDITSWIDANRYELVVQLTPSSNRKEHIVHHLSRGPALLLFLPLKLHTNSVTQNILDTYIYAASQYHKCLCNGTTKEWNAAEYSDANRRRISSEISQQINVDGISSDSSQFALVNFIDRQKDMLISGNDVILHKVVCMSILVPRIFNIGNKHNTCDLCYTCQVLKCGSDIGHPLESFLNHKEVMALLSLKNCCSTLRPKGYFSFVSRSICCTCQTGESSQPYKSFMQINDTNLNPLRQTKRSLDDSFGDFLTLFMPRTKTTISKSPSTRKVRDVTTRNSFPRDARFDSLQTFPGNKGNLFQTTNPITDFTGAGCYSNRSVNFFVVDSTEYWRIAEKLGVRRTHRRVALVIADLKNNAQFVLDEAVQISNSSIVNFVLAYMRGNLTRRFISGREMSPLCVPSHEGKACISEVVTSNFRDIVLDDTKDVLLLFYASWCAYCQALEPILLTVAKFFQDSDDVTIARINADENDLPWEFYVSQYPSFILFPAQRKKFSVRLPDAMERTSANIIHFVLDHGLYRNKRTQHLFA